MTSPVTRAVIDDFLAQKTLAVAGVSRSGKGFGAIARKELVAKGYTLRLLHPEAETIAGEPCARSVRDVAADVGGLLLVTPPAQTAALVREAAEAGIRRVWMQQGAESDEAIAFCEEHGMAVVHHQCILMFAAHPGFPHRLHGWLKRTFGSMPA